MARTALTIYEDGDLDGFDLTTNLTTGQADGYYWVNDGATYIYLENTSGGSLDATLVASTQENVDGAAYADKTLTIPANKAHIFGPVSKVGFHTADSPGRVWVNFAGASETDFQILIFRINKAKT